MTVALDSIHLQTGTTIPFYLVRCLHATSPFASFKSGFFVSAVIS